MRDSASTVLAALAALLLGALATGPPARAASAEQAAEAAEQHAYPYTAAAVDPIGDAIAAKPIGADAEQPATGTPPADSDDAQSPEAAATDLTEPVKANPQQAPESAPTTGPDEITANEPPEPGAGQSDDVIAKEPAPPDVTPTAGADVDTTAAERSFQTTDGQSADAPSQPSSATEPADPAFTSTPDADDADEGAGQPADASDSQSADASGQSLGADPAPGPASPTVTQLAEWAVSASDTAGLPFIVVDKPAAEVFVFDPSGQLLGSAPALLGSAFGDDSAPGVGDRELSAIPLADRTTPAGRFIADIGPAEGFRSVLWVDFATATSLHAVITNYPKERRLERLKSPYPGDRRITHGCINVPAAFYRDVVRPTFAGKGGVVYVLPDSKSVEEVFPAIAGGSALDRARADLEPSPP